MSNDENELLTLIADVAALAEGEPVLWATDLNQGGAALMIQLLADHGQELLYIPEELFTTHRRLTVETERRMRKTPRSSLTKPG